MPGLPRDKEAMSRMDKRQTDLGLSPVLPLRGSIISSRLVNLTKPCSSLVQNGSYRTQPIGLLYILNKIRHVKHLAPRSAQSKCLDKDSCHYHRV